MKQKALEWKHGVVIDIQESEKAVQGLNLIKNECTKYAIKPDLYTSSPVNFLMELRLCAHSNHEQLATALVQHNG